MSRKQRSKPAFQQRARAAAFAALGDGTRLALVTKLAGGRACSISQLTEGSSVTRQAIRKHLGVLETAGMVRSVRQGREHRFEFSPRPIDEMKEYLEFVSAQWDMALGRLKSLVES